MFEFSNFITILASVIAILGYIEIRVTRKIRSALRKAAESLNDIN